MVVFVGDRVGYWRVAEPAALAPFEAEEPMLGLSVGRGELLRCMASITSDCLGSTFWELGPRLKTYHVRRTESVDTCENVPINEGHRCSNLILKHSCTITHPDYSSPSAR